MVMGSLQLAEDYEQLNNLLESHPHISIVKTEGQPPDNYEIEYKIRGYVKDTDNTINVGTNHKIRISLPFGYPHFAPIAKPLTPIFHPDFDPAAIRIADQWQLHPSLAEIVRYIGKMISGSVYHLETPFNQEAADWYATHQNELPLDSPRTADIEETEIALDSLGDDTFASLGLEDNDFFELEKTVDASEIEHIRNLIVQHKIFTAHKLLSDLPEKITFSDREEIQLNIGKILRKTDQLFKLAEQLEDMGKFNEAIEVVNNLLEIAADAPGVESLRARIHESFQFAQSITPHPKKKKRGDEKSPEAPAKLPPPHPPKSKSAPKPNVSRNALPSRPLFAIILILGVCIGAISLYFKDQNILSQSQANLLKGQLLLEKKQFDSALETLKAANSILSDLTILRLRKNLLEQKINTLISSADLQEGLQGRILYQGEFISTETATALNELTVLTDQAEALVRQNKIPEALVIYGKALKYAKERHLEKQHISINNMVQSVELRYTLALAEKAEQGNNWDEAADAYRQALSLAGSIKDLGTSSDITHRLTAAIFRRDLDQSKKAFTQSQWQETIKFLEQAQQTITSNPNIITDKERQELHRLLVNSRLFLMLSTAKEAYQQKNWNLAIEEYQHALALLAHESDNVEDARDESLAKIEKTLLLVNIAQIQEKILVAESKNDVAAILAHNKEILKLIRSSNFANDSAVKTVMQSVNEKIDKQQELIALNEKISWLEEHYEEIFRANYPTFQGSKLLKPKAVFLKKVDNKPIFSITCVERSQGSSSKLELNYMFDSGSGKWVVYNGR